VVIDSRAGGRPAGGVVGGHDHACGSAADRSATAGTGGHHYRQGEGAGGRGVALDRGGGASPSHHAARDTLPSAVRLPAPGRRVARVVYRERQLGDHRRAAERGGVPSAEADEPVHRGDGPAFDGSPGPGPASTAWEYGRAGT